MTEQRYRAVLQVQAGSSVVEVADACGVSRQAVHRWLRWYREEGLAGLADRSHRPKGHPAQTPSEVEAAVCELRRAHLRSLPNPVTEPGRLRDARPGGSPPVIPDQLPSVQRRVDERGSISVARQRIHVGIHHAGLTVTVQATDTTFQVSVDGQLLAEVSRTTNRRIARYKVRKPEAHRRGKAAQ